MKKIIKLLEDIKNLATLYRGSDFDDEFGVGNYFTTDYNFAKDYTKTGNVKKYKVDLGRVFNIVNPEHFKILKDAVGEITDPYADEDNYPELIDIQEPSVIAMTNNTWEVTEQFLDTIPNLDIEGFDSAEIWEDGIVNYVVFNPKGRVFLDQTNEKYFATIKSGWADADVYKNPSLQDISNLIKNSSQKGETIAFKFVIDLSTEDVYVWDGFKSLHQPIVDKLNLAPNNDWGNLCGGNILRTKEGYKVYWDSLTFKNSPKQIQKAGILLNYYIKHEALATSEALRQKSPILINPSLKEIKDKLKEIHDLSHHKYASVRFVIDKQENYYIANADEWIHDEIIKEMGINKVDNITGEFTEDGYLWFHKYMTFHHFNITDPNRVFMSPEEVINLFKRTKMYSTVKSIISKIEFQ